MDKRGKIINGLEWALEHSIDRGCEFNFAGYDGWEVVVNEPIIRDALELLKAQEPVEPKILEFVDEGVTWQKYEVPSCGICGALLGDALYCPQCGRAVRWE